MKHQTDVILSTHDLTVSFVNQHTAENHVVLNHLQLDIKRGQFLCVLGPSGCGKTTLLNCIAGFQPPTHGEVMLEEKAIAGPGKERGVMFQEYGLFPWFNVLQNVAFGPRVNGMPKQEAYDLARSYIKLVGLEGFEGHYPSRLSGGMKQRVSLARVLCNRPRFLLMDEPFAALDEQTRFTLQEELLKIWGKEKITCLFVTHSISEAVYLADRVIVLMPNPGRVALDLEIDLPRIRDRNDERVFQYEKQIAGILKGGAA